jgi:hypothetical protein
MNCLFIYRFLFIFLLCKIENRHNLDLNILKYFFSSLRKNQLDVIRILHSVGDVCALGHWFCTADLFLRTAGFMIQIKMAYNLLPICILRLLSFHLILSEFRGGKKAVHCVLLQLEANCSMKVCFIQKRMKSHQTLAATPSNHGNDFSG